MPSEKGTIRRERQQVLPRVPVEAPRERETRARVMEYRKDELHHMPGSNPTGPEPAPIPRRYKNWNLKGEVVWTTQLWSYQRRTSGCEMS